MTETINAFGCGKPATTVICRGPVKRLFACDTCRPLYTGRGYVAAYAAGDPAQNVKGSYFGAPHVCGDEVAALSNGGASG